MKLTALLSIIPAILLANCQTSGTASSSPGNPHPDLPANYRQQIAEFMRTQFPSGIKGAEVSDPHRAFAGLILGGDRDWVCVRVGITVFGYVFKDKSLHWDTGGIVSQLGRGVLAERLVCGENPNFKPFPEVDYQSRA